MTTLTSFVRNWKLREREASCFEAKRSVMVQLIDTIGRCHGRSVYHRDLKPENVLVHENSGSIRLIDFGLAVVDPISSNCRTGTREYMSPGMYSFLIEFKVLSLKYAAECFSEFNVHAKGTPFDSAANDVWSLGGMKCWQRRTTKLLLTLLYSGSILFHGWTKALGPTVTLRF